MYFFLIEICLIGSVVGSVLEVSELNITKLCLSDVINRNFANSTFLNIITDNSDTCNEFMLNLGMIPRTVLKIGEEFENGKNSLYGDQFVVCSNNESRIEEDLRIGRGKIPIVGNGIYLIVVGEGDVSKIFHMFWEIGVINVFVLVNDNEKTTLYSSNPFAEENECGQITKNIVPHSCDSQWVLPNKTLLNLNGCPIKFNVSIEEMWSVSGIQYILVILRNLAQYYGGSLDVGSQIPGRSNGTNIIISLSETPNDRCHDVTMPLISDSVIWLVPKVIPISSLSAVRHTFQNEVWYLIFVIFMLTSIAWWFIISHKMGHFTFVGKLTTAIIIVWSLTFTGTIRNTPTRFTLRCILFTYSIYMIHINCAFTSNYINILTEPRHDFQVSNLRDLAESNLPIYIDQLFKDDHFSKNDTKSNLYTKLQDLLVPRPFDEYMTALQTFNNYRNFAIITMNEYLDAVGPSELRYNSKEIKDNTIIGDVETRLVIDKNHYFTEFLNRFLQKIVESRIGDKELDMIKSETEMETSSNITENDGKVGISLIHLSFAFFFFGIGLLASLLAFFMEIIIHRYFN